MAIAKKCDICGDFYEEYNYKQAYDKPNGFMYLNIDARMKYYSGKVTDCCPVCMESIMNHVKSLKKI